MRHESSRILKHCSSSTVNGKPSSEVVVCKLDFASANSAGSFSYTHVCDAHPQDPSVAPLVLEGFPENTAFHPHGIHYRQETGELFVINHAYTMGGERIEVFKVSATGQSDLMYLFCAKKKKMKVEGFRGVAREKAFLVERI